MIVALTGGTGFVGRAVLRELLTAGHRVRALERSSGQIEASSAVSVVKGSLEDTRALSELVIGADTLIHCAGIVKAFRGVDFDRTNVDGTRRVVAAARENGVRHVVLVSSLAATRPEISAYARSKYEAEECAREAAAGLKLTILRPTAVYGPGDTATLPLLRELMKSWALIPGLSNSRFSLVHVDDLARICVAAVQRQPEGLFEIDDRSGGHDWPELVSLSQRHFGRPRRVSYLPRPVAIVIGLACDGLARMLRKPMMTSADKIRELYASEWLVKPSHWPDMQMTPLAVGLPATMRWYQDRGLLPVVNQTHKTDTR